MQVPSHDHRPERDQAVAGSQALSGTAAVKNLDAGTAGLLRWRKNPPREHPPAESTPSVHRTHRAVPPCTRRRWLLAAVPWCTLPAACATRSEAKPQAPTLQVGPGRALQTIAEAARRARDGDLVEVDAGEYRGEAAIATWTQERLTIRAAGGRVRLVADGRAAEGKAIWVVRGGRIAVSGFDFEGARVAARNGAGIRFEAGHLTVRHCRFTGNEMGLLTSNDARAELVLQFSEFAHNLRPDGHDHQLYAGSIASLAVWGCWFHHGSVGHLLKSRATVSRIFYSRLTDEAGGTSSYELEFPNGGVALVLGNVVQQGPMTDNPIMISYGAEGYRWPRNALALVHNTLVDELPEGGRYLRVVPGGVDLLAACNLLAGNASRLEGAGAGAGEYRANAYAESALFADPAAYDYRIRQAAAAALPAPTDPGRREGMSLVPTHEYLHPCATRALRRRPALPGALQTSAAA